MDNPAEFNAGRPPSLKDPSIRRPISHGWRPGYLRRQVIFAFNMVFMLSLIALEALSAISKRQKGLTGYTQRSLYLWTLGPTTVITVILVFWSRVEYQANRLMPWIVLARPLGKEITPDLQAYDCRQTILLDYSDMLSPKAIWLSFKNKHWLMFVGILSSMIIRVQIVLSSGLFSIEFIHFQQDISVPLLDQISDKLPNQEDENFVDYRPYRTDLALLDVGLQYPNFTSPGLALQQFDIQRALSTMENSTELTVVVDGLSLVLTCDLPPAVITMSSNEFRYDVNST
ncbi:hypothetical protein GGR51DRAFT_559484 [Nemania sp. FL0031]|nr:hypothetical protein GGR51DRAFT_559484 [Nemania sp. FL0031]